MFRSSIITYDGLPVSKGGAHRAHRLRTPDPKLALRQARDFLTACTDNSIPKVAFVEVIRGHSFDDEFSLPLIEQLKRRLGDSSRRQAGTRNVAHRWNLKADQIDEYVDMVNEALPLPVDPFGLQPFVVAAQINFRILDPQTRVALSGQESELYGNYSAHPGQLLGVSQLYARFSGRSTFRSRVQVSCRLRTTSGVTFLFRFRKISGNNGAWRKMALATWGVELLFKLNVLRAKMSNDWSPDDWCKARPLPCRSDHRLLSPARGRAILESSAAWEYSLVADKRGTNPNDCDTPRRRTDWRRRLQAVRRE